ncbi:hypothetical protein SAMN05444972_107109 [Marininema halotolerans]|uniref:Uncharacterized protein n=1 Tax=Marininema halotolerans TaxID=1155944 RepID=A0A1I6SID4_9BACL|nr:hypothetical protein SAMN05444972_107109 [Marininema halotolerans]
MSTKEIEQASTSYLLSKLAISPLYIIMVLLSVLYLYLHIKEKGFIVLVGKIGSVFYISIYLLALYFFISELFNA